MGESRQPSSSTLRRPPLFSRMLAARWCARPLAPGRLRPPARRPAAARPRIRAAAEVRGFFDDDDEPADEAVVVYARWGEGGGGGGGTGVAIRRRPCRPAPSSPPAAPLTPAPAPATRLARAKATAAAGAALARHAAVLASNHALPVVAAFAAADAAAWVVHRVSHRATNAVAAALLPGVGAAVAGSGAARWWLCADPGVATFATGYQWVVLAFFLLSFPATLALRAAAAAAAALVCGRGPAPAWPPPRPSVAGAVAEIRAIVPTLRGRLADVAWTEVAVAARAVPLQALSLLVLPLPFTLPRLVDLLLTPPSVSLGGASGDVALARGAALARGRRGALGAPYLALLLASRALAAARAAAAAALPPRVAAGVPELPLLLWAGGALAALALARTLDVLPAAAYLRFQEEGEEGREAAAV